MASVPVTSNGFKLCCLILVAIMCCHRPRSVSGRQGCVRRPFCHNPVSASQKVYGVTPFVVDSRLSNISAVFFTFVFFFPSSHFLKYFSLGEGRGGGAM